MDSTSLLKSIGNKLRVLRTEKGLTQESLAAEIGMSASAFAKIERGESDLSISKIEKIAKQFDLTLIELLTLSTSNYINFKNHQGIIGQNITNTYVNSDATKETIQQLVSEVAGLKEEIERLKKDIVRGQ
jgi:transcriptional regulator with XRE-family HTH domain